MDSSLKTSAVGIPSPVLSLLHTSVALLLGIKNSEAEPLLVHPDPSLQSDSTLDFWSQASPSPDTAQDQLLGLFFPPLCLKGCRILQWSPLLGFGSDDTAESQGKAGLLKGW